MKPSLLKARILSYISGLANLLVLDTNELVTAKAKGIFYHRNQILKPMVGDYVLLSHVQDKHYLIEEILDRKNALIRPKVSNLDEVIILQSAVEPDFNSFILNKYLAFFEHHVSNVKIAFSKTDLLDKEKLTAFKKVINEYRNDNYQVYNVNDSVDFNHLKQELGTKTVCLVGNSGVGKSTLLNRIDSSLLLRTQAISKALNRGKHTTTNVFLIKYQDGYLVDTPGFSSLELSLSKQELATSFHDFYTSSVNCKFSNCLHLHEPQCAVKEKVKAKQISESRYQDYLKLLKEVK